MTDKTTTTAEVTLTVTITDLGTWGDDCTMGQIHKQASDAAISRLNRAFTGGGIGIVHVSLVDIDTKTVVKK